MEALPPSPEPEPEEKGVADIDCWILGGKIGEGMYGKVFAAEGLPLVRGCRRTAPHARGCRRALNGPFSDTSWQAIKVQQPPEHGNEDQAKLLRREFETLQLLMKHPHPNVVACHGFYQMAPCGSLTRGLVRSARQS